MNRERNSIYTSLAVLPTATRKLQNEKARPFKLKLTNFYCKTNLAIIFSFLVIYNKSNIHD